jgi:hypothetical protein
LILHFLDEQSKIAAPVVVYERQDAGLGRCKEGNAFAFNLGETKTANATSEKEGNGFFSDEVSSGRKKIVSKQAALLPVG